MAVDRLGGTPEAEATFRGQLEIVRMTGRQTIIDVCCTRSMLYSFYAVLGVCCTRCMLHSALTHDDGMERWRGMTELCVLAMMVELWPRK